MKALGKTDTIEVRGRKITASTNAWPVVIAFSEANVNWLLKELWSDVSSNDDRTPRFAAPPVPTKSGMQSETHGTQLKMTLTRLA